MSNQRIKKSLIFFHLLMMIESISLKKANDKDDSCLEPNGNSVIFHCPQNQICDDQSNQCRSPFAKGDSCRFSEQCEGLLFCDNDYLCSDGRKVGESCTRSKNVKLNILGETGWLNYDFELSTDIISDKGQGHHYCNSDSSGCIFDWGGSHFPIYPRTDEMECEIFAVYDSIDLKLHDSWGAGMCHGKFKGGSYCKPGQYQCSPNPTDYDSSDRQYIDVHFNVPVCMLVELSTKPESQFTVPSQTSFVQYPRFNDSRSYRRFDDCRRYPELCRDFPRFPRRTRPPTTPPPTSPPFPKTHVCERRHILNEKCSEDYECYQGLTYDKIKSRDLESCSVGQRLQSTSMVCFEDPHAADNVRRCMPRRRLRETCTRNADCQSQHICHDNYCYLKDYRKDLACVDKYECNPIADPPTIPCYTSIPDDPDYGTCRALGKDGDSCVSDSHCIDSLFCFILPGDAQHHRCTDQRGLGESCAADDECSNVHRCVRWRDDKFKTCRPWGITTKSLSDLTKWFARYQVAKQADFCWRPFAVAKTCGPNQDQIGLDCYKKCDPGDVGVGPLCWSGWVPYGRAVPWGQQWVWACPADYNPAPLYCEHKCPVGQPIGCIAGCAKSTDLCITNTAGMILGPLALLANILTFGATTAIGKSLKAATAGLKALGKQKLTKAFKLLKTTKYGEIPLDTLGHIDTARSFIEPAIRNFTASATEDVFDNDFKQWLADAGCVDDSPTMPDCQRELRKHYGKEVISVELENITGADYETVYHMNSVMDADFNNAITMVAMADPTGLVGAIAPFVKPQCLYPDTDLSKLIVKKQDLAIP